MKVEIQSVHFHADQKLKDFIEKKVEKLETFYDKIIESNVILSLEHNNAQVKDKSAVIKLRLPGTVLVAKEISKSFEESADKAVDHLRRQLKKYKSRMREHV